MTRRPSSLAESLPVLAAAAALWAAAVLIRWIFGAR